MATITPMLSGRMAARVVAGAVAITATIVIAGWVFQAPAVTTFGQPWTPMVVSTSLCVLLGAGAIALLSRDASRESWRLVHAIAAIMAMIAGLTLADFLGDRLLGTTLLPRVPWVRMAPNTAAVLLLVAGGILLAGRSPRTNRAAEWVLGAGLFGAAVDFFAFLFGATPRSELMGKVNMSPITGTCLAAIAMTLLFQVPGGRFASVVAGRGPGSRMARPLFALVIFAPVLLSQVRLQAELKGYITLEYAVAMMALSMVVVSGAGILWYAARVNRYDVQQQKLYDDVARELEKRTEAEQALRALTAELERRVADRTAELALINRELETFAYSVSHDLRTPLRALDGFSQAVLEDYGDRLDDAGRNYLDRIRRGSQRMADLIDALLDLSRVSRAQVQRDRVDMSALASDIIEALRDRAPDRAVRAIVEPGMIADGDARLLRALLQNLLGNAWKFTGQRSDARIEFTRQSDNGHPVYVVRDNGTGFDMAYASKLFGAFQRLHTDKEFEGTGVGLATAQRIVHRHAGKIWAEATPGVGAAFFFTLG